MLGAVVIATLKVSMRKGDQSTRLHDYLVEIKINISNILKMFIDKSRAYLFLFLAGICI